MTTSAPPSHSRSPRHRAADLALDPALRAWRVEVARWALAHGRPLNVDAVSVIIGARHAEAITEGTPFNRWTTNSVLTFLFGTADRWCGRQGIPVPLHLGESLLTYVDFLDSAGVLAPSSSSIRQLRTTIVDLTGLTTGGLRRAARASAHPPAPAIELARARSERGPGPGPGRRGPAETG